MVITSKMMIVLFVSAYFEIHISLLHQQTLKLNLSKSLFLFISILKIRLLQINLSLSWLVPLHVCMLVNSAFTPIGAIRQ